MLNLCRIAQNVCSVSLNVGTTVILKLGCLLPEMIDYNNIWQTFVLLLTEKKTFPAHPSARCHSVDWITRHFSGRPTSTMTGTWLCTSSLLLYASMDIRALMTKLRFVYTCIQFIIEMLIALSLDPATPNFIRCWLDVDQCLFMDEELNSLGNDQKSEGLEIKHRRSPLIGWKIHSSEQGSSISFTINTITGLEIMEIRTNNHGIDSDL